MFNREQAAKYFIVAWVKDWSMNTYLDAIYEGKKPEGFDSLSTDYPWLPSHAHWYLANRGRGMPVRRLVADFYRVLGDKLWDAPNDKARLNLWSLVAGMVAGDAKAKSRLNQSDRHESTKTAREYRANVISSSAQAEWREANGRRSWNTVKA